MLEACALAALGFLTGHLVGLTGHSVVDGVLSMLFAFAGGSAIALRDRLGPRDRRDAATLILALCLSCLVGLYSGLVVETHDLLGHRPTASEESAQLLREVVEKELAARRDATSAAERQVLVSLLGVYADAAQRADASQAGYMFARSAADLDAVSVLHHKVTTGLLGYEEAYRELHRLVSKATGNEEGAS